MRVIAIFVCFGISTAHAQAISGTYTSERGATTLVQDGSRVIGAYRSHGEIDGTIDGDVVRFTWRENAGLGRGMFLVAANGELLGTWGNGSDDHDGGSWRLTPVAAVVVSPIASAISAPPVHHAGQWSFGVRFPWDVTLLSGSTGVGLGGFGVDGGVRVTEQLYLGGSADLEMVMATGGMDAPSTLDRLRAGAEARYYAHDSTAPSIFGGHQSWVGARGGFETVDSDRTVGRFAELSVGRDSQLGGSLLMGLYISAGMSFESASAYQDMTSSAPSVARVTDTSPTIASPYFAFGMRLGFQ